MSWSSQISELRGEPKGLRAILREGRLWPANGRRRDGIKFLLQCPTLHGWPGCIPDLQDGCCARTVMASQQEAAVHLMIFYPKFHCELIFIERFWCAAKWYVRGNCEYIFVG